MSIIYFSGFGLNADSASFVSSGNPWFLRGGYHAYGLIAGVFAFHHDHGDTNVNVSFRVVFVLFLIKGQTIDSLKIEIKVIRFF